MTDNFSNRPTSHFLPLAIIIIAIIGIYGVTVTYEFVNYDDYSLIVENTKIISQPSNIFSVFTTHAFSGSGKEGSYYRPLLLASYIFDYQTWGLNPAGYHLTNLALHILSTILVYFLFRLFIQDVRFAVSAAFLFGLHPVQVESVAWIAGRDNILLGLGITAMMFFYILQYNDAQKRRLYLVLSIVSFIVALFAKEAALFFVFLLPLYEYSIRHIPLRTQLSRTFIRRYMMYCIPLVVYVGFRMNAVGGFIGSEYLHGSAPIAERLTQLPAVLAENIRFLLFPVQLSIQHPLDQSFWQTQPWYSLVIIIVIISLAALWFTWKRNRLLFFFAGWLILGLFPLLNILPLAVPIMEHRLYTAVFGVIGFLLVFIHQYINDHNHAAAMFLILFMVLATMTGTILRVPVWKNSETLWHDTIEKNPTSFRAHFNLAGYYYERGQYDSTISLLQKCIEIQPGDYNGYSKLIQTYITLNQPENIVGVYRRMITVKPYQQSRYLELGIFFEQRNLPDSALQVYRKGLRIDSNFYQIHFRLGKIYYNRQEISEAEQHFSVSIKIKPDFAPPYFELAVLEAARGNNTRAREYFDRGKQFQLPSPEVASIIMNIDKR